MIAATSSWLVVAVFVWGSGAFVCALAAARIISRSPHFGSGQTGLTVAMTATAVWALTGVVFGAGSHWTHLAESGRNLAWLFALYRMYAIDGRHANLAPVRPLAVVITLVELLRLGIELIVVVEPTGGAFSYLAFPTATLLRLLMLSGALMLVHNLYAGVMGQARLALRWPALALAILWGFDLNHYTLTYLGLGSANLLTALRGLASVAVGILLLIGTRRGSETLRFAPSRSLMFQSASLLIIGAYLVFMVILSRWLDWVGQDMVANLELALAGLTALALAVISASPVWRSKLRVLIAKNLFQHRYDYREEWLRFTRTIGRPGASDAAFHERAIRAIADMTDSPAGLLFTPSDQGHLELAARWQWPTAEVPSQALPLTTLPAFECGSEGGFIVDLDELRGVDAANQDGWVPAQRAVPQWLLAEPRAWALVPLHHFDRLVGMVVLARPNLARRLDWEDFDLLRVAGRQLASYLAEQAGQEALAEVGRFDDFNRRIAFVMHDIKNLASQIGLLARNAESHAENPEFRADMLVTLRNAADKLNTLIARLSRYGTGPIEQLAPVDADRVARRVVAQFAVSHQVQVIQCEGCRVAAREELLEQVLVHLIQNAVDASKPEEPVFVQVLADGLYGLIEVTDSGSGMSAEFLRTGLFKPFVSTKPGGFGIGAYEARELVQAMDGRLDVESRPGLGSRFSIRLPLAEAAEALRNFSSKVA